MSIVIKEAMQADVYGTKYLVDGSMKVWYLRNGSKGSDNGGQGMGKVLPFIGQVAASRISWRDSPEGVEYHYEVAVGQNKPNLLVGLLQQAITGKFTTDMCRVWRRHNTIEVGCFENFLPAIFAQRLDVVGDIADHVFVYDANTMDAAKGLAVQPAASGELALKRFQQLLIADDAINDVMTAKVFA